MLTWWSDCVCFFIFLSRENIFSVSVLLVLSHTQRKMQIVREMMSKCLFLFICLFVYLCTCVAVGLDPHPLLTTNISFLKHSKSHYFCTSLFCSSSLVLPQNQATSIHEKGNILYEISHHGCVTQSHALPSLHQPPLQSISGGFFGVDENNGESFMCCMADTVAISLSGLMSRRFSMVLAILLNTFYITVFLWKWSKAVCN